MTPEQKKEFAEAVYEIVRLIPPGRASTYGAIARASGFPRHARLTGKLMSGSVPGVPAHRVVASGGRLSAEPAFGPPGHLQSLLAAEGIETANGRIRNWKKTFWDPIVEL